MSGKGGSIRSALARVFGDSENPLSWALTIGRVWGIRVRVHVVFIIYAIGVVLFSIARDTLGVGYTLLEMAALFGIVLLHEFGHCFAARAMAGEADEVLLWPLGGLALTHPPDTWRAHLAVALGGPAVNVALIPVFAIALTAIGRGDAILFDPRHVSGVLATMSGWGEVALWWAHCVNLAVLGFNFLVPMLPLDGGRALEAALWGRVGRRRATETAAVVGLVCAGGLGIAGLVMEEGLLIGVAVFGGLVCWAERRRLRAPDEIGETAYAVSLREQEREREADAERAAKARRAREEEEAAMDRILAKIAAEGLDRLTPRERRTLDEASARKRAGG